MSTSKRPRWVRRRKRAPLRRAWVLKEINRLTMKMASRAADNFMRPSPLFTKMRQLGFTHTPEEIIADASR